jgi:hypothetical protein
VDGIGNVFVIGHASGPGGGDDFLTLKYSDSGVPLWTNRYNGPGNADDWANGVTVDSNGNVFVTGGTTVGGPMDFVTIKYSGAGVPMWTNRYKGPGNSIYGGAGDVAVDSKGDVIIIGDSVGSGTSDDFATIKYSNAGVPIWTNRYNRVFSDVPINIAIDRSDNIFVSGYTMHPITLGFDNTVIAYSSAGNLLLENFYNGPGNGDDSGNAIAVDPKGNAFVAGYSQGTNGVTDIATIKIWGYQPIFLNVGLPNGSTVLAWENPNFRLQSASALTGTFTNIPGATSPFTNSITAGQKFFRLKLN